MTRSQIIMVLLASPGKGKSPEPIQGTTRLQKLLFLVEREGGLGVTEGPTFEFTPYKFGPVSKSLYDDITKLENLGLLKSESIAEPTAVEKDEYGLSFDDLMGDVDPTSAFEEKRYGLTPRGVDWLSRHQVSQEVSATINRVKGKYGSLSLSDLLHYVYTRYPDMTTASEIKERVLGF